MAESTNSSSVNNTPTYIVNKFSSPTWVVKVNGTPVSDAILQTVNLGFGSDISNAVFSLPRNPFIPGNPVEGDSVEVIANGRSIFFGTIRVKLDHVGIDGLKITYTATSGVTTFNRPTLKKAAFNSSGSDFPLTQFTAKEIFSQLSINVNGVPNVYPGAVDVTDQTQLSAAESILAKLGNYKLYWNGSELEVYTLGSGGVNQRSFILGKNIITANLTKSTENIVDEVTIVGAAREITVRQVILNPRIQMTSDGRKYFVILLTGENIRNIKVEGLTREQPNIIYDNHIFVNRAMLTGVVEPITSIPPTEDEDNLNDDTQSSTINDQFTLRPKIRNMETFNTDWTVISAGISSTPPPFSTKTGGFVGTFIAANTAFISLSELPKIWEAEIISGQVPNEVLGIEALGSQQVEILNKFKYTAGTVRVTYTVDGTKPEVTVGSGVIKRSISDSQFKIVINTVTGENTEVRVLADMQRRAQAEYDRTHLPEITGTIAVIGDETIDLRQAININGDILDILHITHNFTQGFTTEVTLTNEKFRGNFVASSTIQNIRTTHVDTENDKRRNNNLISQETEELKRRERQAETEAKRDNEPPTTGPYAVFR